MHKLLIAIPLEEAIDKHIGKIGTPRRDAFERKLAGDVRKYYALQVKSNK